MFRSLIIGLALCAASSALAAPSSTPLSYELARLAEIVNTQIPYQYRTQLNMAIGRLEMTAGEYCDAGSRRPPVPTCNVVANSGSYVVVRENSVMSQYYRNSIIAAKKDYDELVSAGVCPNEDLRMACSVENSSGSFIVKRNGEIASRYYRSSAIAAAQDMREMASAGLCF